MAVFALLLPASASAAPTNCQAPPGTSGIDQYCEALPGAGGTGGNQHKKKQHVAPAVTKKLQGQGNDGAAILQLTESSGAASAETNTPAAKPKTHHKKKSATTPDSSSTTTPALAKPVTPVVRPEPNPGNDPFSAVGNSFSSSTGVSGGFAWVLVGIGLIFGAMAWVSYRGRTRESAS